MSTSMYRKTGSKQGDSDLYTQRQTVNLRLSPYSRRNQVFSKPRATSIHELPRMASLPSDRQPAASDPERHSSEGLDIGMEDHELPKNEQPDQTENANKKRPLTAKQAAKLDPSTSTKACDQCGKPSDVLIRCRKDESEKWFLLCPGNCWKAASGGKVDGAKDTPWYRYGGVWKNKKAATSGKKPKHVPS